MLTILLLIGLIATLVWQTRLLPAQTVLVASAITALIAGVVESIGAASGIPFGARVFLDAFGQKIFGLLPWPIPLLWIVFLQNARGVARLILRPWRKSKTYGFRVIGLACLLLVALDLSFEVFASRANHFWIWQTPKTVLTWHGAPWVKFLSTGLTALLILAFATPWLINKHPAASKRPPDYQPLILWTAMNLYFLLANGLAGFRIAMVFGIIATFVTAMFAIRGARW